MNFFLRHTLSTATVCLLLACGGDDAPAVDAGALDASPIDGEVGSCTHTIEDLAGSWSSSGTGTGQVSCFMGTMMWIGDRPDELHGAVAPCMLTSACTFTCQGSSGTARIDEDGALHLAFSNCSGTPDTCEATYVPDSSLTCGP